MKEVYLTLNPDQSLNDSCLLLLVRQAGYIVNLSEFYSYRLIGKLTAFFFLQLQEFSFRSHTQVTSSPSAARLSSHELQRKVVHSCVDLVFSSHFID